MKLIHILIGLLLATYIYGQNNNTIDWEADLDFLSKELPKKHFNFYALKSEAEFYAKIAHIKSKSKNLSNIAVALQLQQLIASFGDSHTRIEYTHFIHDTKILPLSLYWFSDGLYILQTTKENLEILKHQIVSINGFSLQTIVDSLKTLITIDNEAIVKNSIPKLVPMRQLLDYFGFTNGQDIALGLKDSDGKAKTFNLKSAVMNVQNKVKFDPETKALCYQNVKSFFSENYIANDKIYYLQYNKCWSKELESMRGNAKNAEAMPSFKDFEEKVFQTLQKENIEKIAFDIRFNGGGSSKQGSEFIAKLAKYVEKKPTTKVYVILGRNTFSSAIINAMDCKRLKNVVFVGEETSGMPNHYGEIRDFQLPNSGMEVIYSTKYFKLTNEDISTIKPDIKLEMSFEDFVKGNDPVYTWIKEQ